LFDSLAKDRVQDYIDGSNASTIIEVGMGTFPNAPYYVQARRESALEGLDIISVDPNDSMFGYAKENAEKSGLLSLPNTSLRSVHGVAEALPFANGSVDAVVGTLTLCSVSNQERALSEIRRVLKPNTGKYLFWEHVLSEDSSGLALQQKVLSPIQTLVADGCHLNRRTGANIQNAGFLGGVEMTYVNLGVTDIISPTVFGIATA
jgi:ubiquinone/menaquinone biosynthesis C-methylase UbiE